MHAVLISILFFIFSTSSCYAFTVTAFVLKHVVGKACEFVAIGFWFFEHDKLNYIYILHVVYVVYNPPTP